MSEKTEKANLPVYIPYKGFSFFINGLKERGIPQQIDRSIFPTMSGSGQSAMMAGLRFLNLIDNNSKPTNKLKQLVDASSENYSTALRDVLVESYAFLTKGDLNLEFASGKQVEDKFREQGASGSTITKCVAFFLAAARDAGIKVSSHVRPPKIARIARTNGIRKKQAGKEQCDEMPDEVEDDADVEIEGADRFQIPIPGKRNATIIIPKDLTTDDWDMLQTMFQAYVVRLQKKS